MKPSWKDAPEWANYLAMDEDGTWAWFRSKPEWHFDGWYTDDDYLNHGLGFANAKYTLEQRPVGLVNNQNMKG